MYITHINDHNCGHKLPSGGTILNLFMVQPILCALRNCVYSDRAASLEGTMLDESVIGVLLLKFTWNTRTQRWMVCHHPPLVEPVYQYQIISIA